MKKSDSLNAGKKDKAKRALQNFFFAAPSWLIYCALSSRFTL
jgi:hypothetical protein